MKMVGLVVNHIAGMGAAVSIRETEEKLLWER